MPEFIQIGRIVGAFGLKGEFKVDPMTDCLDRFQKGSRLRLNGDLVGMQVFSVSGELIGEVDEVLAYPAQDILKVGEIMIPMVQQFIKEIDLEEEKITVELLPGMRPGEELA